MATNKLLQDTQEDLNNVSGHSAVLRNYSAKGVERVLAKPEDELQRRAAAEIHNRNEIESGNRKIITVDSAEDLKPGKNYFKRD